MKDSIFQSLNEQANHELFAAHSYLAMALWCKDRDFNGYAKFFWQQSAEEKEHADKFQKHLLDRSKMPLPGALEAPRTNFPSLIDVARQALALEETNSAKIQACYALSEKEKDYASLPMLLWFINEQVEEEDWAHTMITLTARAECAGAIYNLDRHIVKELTSDDE